MSSCISLICYLGAGISSLRPDDRAFRMITLYRRYYLIRGVGDSVDRRAEGAHSRALGARLTDHLDQLPGAGLKVELPLLKAGLLYGVNGITERVQVFFQYGGEHLH